MIRKYRVPVFNDLNDTFWGVVIQRCSSNLNVVTKMMSLWLQNCNSILSIKNGKDCLPIEDNCLEEERSDDSNCCLRSVILHVRDAYNVFCTIKPKFLSIALNLKNWSHFSNEAFIKTKQFPWRHCHNFTNSVLLLDNDISYRRVQQTN